MPSAPESSNSTTPFWSSYSLRTRYLAVTTIVTAIIIAGALFAQSYVERAGEMRTKSLQLRNETATHIRQLRNSILAIEKNLDAFLWQPRIEHRDSVYQALDKAIAEQQQLYALEWFKTRQLAQEMADFGQDLKGLRISLEHLMTNRLDPANLDPYLAIHTEFFQPATQQFNAATNSALHHIDTYDNGQLHNLLHKPLEDLRTQWLKIDILAEGYNGISSDSRDKELGDFKLLMQKHQALLASLQKLEQNFSSVPQDAALHQDWERIESSAKQWQTGFERLKHLLKNGHKRGDIHFLSTTIEPQIAHIWDYIQKLDVKLEEMASQDVAELAEAATAIAHALWLLAFLGLVLLVTGLIYFERSVLYPIALVAKALRNEAIGHTPTQMPEAQSRETRHLIEAFSQMREQVRQRQQNLEYLALHDTLTGLANREHLVRVIEQELHADADGPHPIAVLLIALDRFKEINISLGHTVGDQLLKAIAERLLHLQPSQRLVARLGGDEFALLLCGPSAAYAHSIALTLIRELEHPFDVANQSLFISACIGIALSPDHGTLALELLQKADVAAHVAKRHRRSVVYYGAEHDGHALRRLGLANTLRLALSGQESGLSLAYQPQVNIFNGKFTGVEVLLRWNHPQEGPIGPDELIPIAEHTGLIYQLTPWVLDRALSEYAHWQPLAENPKLAVNISVHNLYDADFPAKLQRLLEKWQVAPSTLQLEITESAMMADPALAQRTLIAIHKMGVELAIDDFGTGFSSLTYLKHLPVSKLKIDKSFVMSMLENDNDAVIIRSTIDMAHNLGIKVIAEGVENSEVLGLLDILGCDMAQGFHFSRPVELVELKAWAENYSISAKQYVNIHQHPSILNA